MSSHNAQPLRVETEQVGEVIVVSPSGEVDIASVAALQDVLNGCLEEGHHRLVIDLQGLSYLDSTGLGCVTAARARARDEGGELALVCTQPRLLRLFSITGLDQIFTICQTRAQALAAVGGGGQ